MDRKELGLIFKLDMIRAQVHTKDRDKYKQINRIADDIHFGVTLDGKEMDTLDNSFKLYQYCYKAGKSLYAKLSIAYMHEMGQGTAKDTEKALSYYWSILDESMSSKNNHENSVFLPALGRLTQLKLNSMIESTATLWRTFTSYLPSFLY